MTPIVFFDIAGPDDKTLRDFYRNVFSWDISAQSKVHVSAESPLEGAIRRDPAEMRLYLGVDDVATVLEAVTANGGSIDADRFEVPGVVVLGLFRDPAGNPMGLVEMQDGAPKIP